MFLGGVNAGLHMVWHCFDACEMYRGRDTVGGHDDNNGRYGYVSIRRYTVMAKVVAYLLWFRKQNGCRVTLTLLAPVPICNGDMSLVQAS